MNQKTAVVTVRTTRRRRVTALAGLLLAAGAVSACGSGTSTTAASASMTTPPAASPSTSASPSPSVGPSQSAGGGATSAPTPGPPVSPSSPGVASGEPAPVKLPAIGYQSQGNTLTVYFYGGTCDTYGLKADESKAGQVGVRVVITQTAPIGRECPALVKRNAVSAQLSHPLAGRKVVDLATGQDVPNDPGPIGGPQ
ncbi:hypothetical protein [Kitasatospora sp. MAP5-34]|uniref:hypothetical protein n=1 Tax=Kitasatospora sp. MAP5-34 TaxID=3035102 RepID=UPI002474F5AD|nr:hypothetical protein [Kitasatospora sp. MAP5-34]MDH6575081.1 hypothetical protein [Kitasatospora sp. MAP5-34]